MKIKYKNDNIYRTILTNQTLNKIKQGGNLHFTILYHYQINKCNFKQPLMNAHVDQEKFKLIYDQIEKYEKYCFDMIIDLKDGNLLEILYKMSQIEVYSMIIQVLYAAYLMTKNGFYHLDLNNKNIMYKYTKTKYIKIFNYNIPTFGYIWSIIDYGTVVNINYKLSSMNIINYYFII